MSSVIIIIAHKPNPVATELASLTQCHKILGNHKIIMVCPKGLDVSAYRRAVPNVSIDFIDPIWHSSYAMFNRLKIDPFLYNRYKDYEYILFYEMDAWVFKDEFQYWCDQGFDSIGAPWFDSYDEAGSGSKFFGVGNGGFSLRKVASHLRALRSFAYVRRPKILLKELIEKPSWETFSNLFVNLTVRNNTFFLFNDYRFNEDLFWGGVVAKRFPWFRVPDMETASKFSMELNAPLLYEQNNNALPFGCHKWEKYHTAFWSRFIPAADPSFINEPDKHL